MKIYRSKAEIALLIECPFCEKHYSNLIILKMHLENDCVEYEEILLPHDNLKQQNEKLQARVEELEEKLKGAIAAYGEWKQMYENSKSPEEIENRKLIAEVADKLRKNND